MNIRARGSLQIQFLEPISWGEGVSKRKPGKKYPSSLGFQYKLFGNPSSPSSGKKGIDNGLSRRQEIKGGEGEYKKIVRLRGREFFFTFLGGIV